MSQTSDYFAPQYEQFTSPQPTLSESSLDSQQNKVDLIKKQQDALKNLQEQRKQLEALNSSYKSNSKQSTETNFLDFSSLSSPTAPAFGGNSQLSSVPNTSNSNTNQYDVLNRVSINNVLHAAH